MTITRIEVTTYDRTYTEDCYGLMEMVDRVARIQQADNVIGIEVVSMETGEILYSETLVGKIYVAEALVLDLAKEILG